MNLLTRVVSMFWKRPSRPTTIGATPIEARDQREVEARQDATRQHLNEELRRRLLARDAEQRRELARMGVFQRDLNSVSGGAHHHE